MDSALSPVARIATRKFSKSELLWMILFVLILIDLLLVMIYYIRVLQAPVPNITPIQLPVGVTSFQVVPTAPLK
jgi:hypothetical protein